LASTGLAIDIRDTNLILRRNIVNKIDLCNCDVLEKVVVLYSGAGRDFLLSGIL